MIRIANCNDFEQIDKIMNEYFNTKLLYGDPFINFIIDENDLINGLLCYSLIYDRMEINYIVVEKEYRSSSIASNMLKYLDEIAIKNNVKNVTLEVSIDNVSAIKLYEKNGYVKVTIREKYYNGIDGILMIKKIGE